MRDLDFYKALLPVVEAYLEETEQSFADFVELITYDKTETVELEVNGETIVLGGGNTNGQECEIARLDDPIQFAWFSVDKDDVNFLYDEGYYSSWDGGEWENDVRIGIMKQHTINYPEEVK